MNTTDTKTERPTPITDALDLEQEAKSWQSSYFNMRHHARDLERQLAEEGDRIESIGVACGFPKVSDHAQLTETICKKIRRVDKENEELRRQLAERTEQRDRLAEILRETIGGYDFVSETASICAVYVATVINPALATLNESGQ